MSFWKLATETIGTKGVMVVIAIAFGFYLSSHISAFKADIDSQIAAMDAKFEARFDAMDARFDAMDARLDKQNELLLRMIERMDERLLNVELMALVNQKNDVLAMPRR